MDVLTVRHLAHQFLRIVDGVAFALLKGKDRIGFEVVHGHTIFHRQRMVHRDENMRFRGEQRDEFQLSFTQALQDDLFIKRAQVEQADLATEFSHVLDDPRRLRLTKRELVLRDVHARDQANESIDRERIVLGRDGAQHLRGATVLITLVEQVALLHNRAHEG